MGDKTGIQWTEATWNPVVGCEHVSPGCDNCYAATLASGRLSKTPTYAGLAAGGKFNGTVRLLEDRLDQPLRWKRPRMIFVNSMSDLFHKDIPDEFIARVFAVMAATPDHTYQVLTKRHARMRSLLSHGGWDIEDKVEEAMAEFTHASLDQWPLPNVWLGVSVENQQWADIRIPALLDTPAAIRFLSCEPLLGPLDLGLPENHSGHARDRASDGWGWQCLGCGTEDGPEVPWLIPAGPQIGWVIVGGESGPHARPMHPEWVRSLRDQCQAARVPFFHKQWGEWAPLKQLPYDVSPAVNTRTTVVAGKTVYRVGKHVAGRELDGRTWDEFPVGQV